MNNSTIIDGEFTENVTQPNALRGIDLKWVIRGLVADLNAGMDNSIESEAFRWEANGTLHALWTIRDRYFIHTHSSNVHSAVLSEAAQNRAAVTDTGTAVNMTLRSLAVHDPAGARLWLNCLITDY